MKNAIITSVIIFIVTWRKKSVSVYTSMSPAIRIDCLIGSITKYNLNLSSLKLHYDLLTTIGRVA